MIDELFAAASPINPFEDHGCVTPVEKMIFKIDPYLSMPREVRSAETIGRERTVVQGNEPLRMFDDPSGINAHMVGDHIACHADDPLACPVFQLLKRFFASEGACDLVVKQGISRSHGIEITQQLFD